MNIEYDVLMVKIAQALMRVQTVAHRDTGGWEQPNFLESEVRTRYARGVMLDVFGPKPAPAPAPAAAEPTVQKAAELKRKWFKVLAFGVDVFGRQIELELGFKGASILVRESFSASIGWGFSRLSKK